MISFLDGPPRPIQWFALVAGVAGLVYLLSRSRNDWLLYRRGVRTTGKVVEIRRDPTGTGSAPTIAFADASGRVFRLKSDLSLRRDDNWVGAEIPVIYDPRDPSRCAEAGRRYARLGVAALGYLLALVALLVGLFGALADKL